MALTFKEEDHSYTSIDNINPIKWTSVTTFISLFKEKFDAVAASEKASKNKKSKWYKMDPEIIRAYWKKETNRSINVGSFFHNQRESDLTELNTITVDGVDLPIIKPIYVDGIKHAPNQKLKQGIYPEHFAYLKSASICGQADKVEVINDIVNIDDYKTNKEIKTEGYTNWEGITSKMLGPCSHLDDCNFNHYSLQLSTYMYMILKHNPKYKPGKMRLLHIIFEKDGEDQFGYPIIRTDHNNEPIVKEAIPYDVPYLKREVIDMINWFKENNSKLRS